MDDLDQQLAHLQLMNARDLSPKPPALQMGGPGAGGTPLSQSQSTGGPLPIMGLVKKVGPAVPPKPHKKPQQQPHQQQTPQTTAPLAPPPTTPPPPPTIQPSSQSIAQANAASHNVYSNIQLTLDNPAILEQKLEALEHHKRVLESQRRAAAMQQHQQQQHSEPPPPEPPASMMRAGAYDGKIYENQQQLYENMKLSGAGGRGGGNDGGSVGGGGGEDEDYANYRRGGGVGGGQQQLQQQAQQLYGNMGGNNTYSNYNAGQQYSGGGDRASGLDELPPPPPLDSMLPSNASNIPTALNLSLLNSDYHHAHGHEDDLPPPPSPVSSSYSELRRATDHHPMSGGYPMGGGSAAGGGNQTAGSGNYQRLNNGAHHHHHLQQQQQQQHQQMQHQQLQQQQQQQQHHHHQHHHANNDGNSLNGGGATYSNNYAADNYGDYAASLPGSSTYESIYEPINPRPPSQMSSRSNYSLYNPYVSGPQGAGGVGAVSVPPPLNNGRGGGKQQSVGGSGNPLKDEAEVDNLTDLLVQSMDGGSGGGNGGSEGDSYGVCVQCGERVVGESSGCTAMEQIYHITCFTCCQCQINLQGKPFYALDGKPCCEVDYLNTLEKCSVCMKPILERILRATGKPYHPGCFCCVVCGKSLDGVPFTVDATNQNHCIEDFHKKFAPRCCVCRQPILPEPGKEETVRVVALDRSFHVSCYKCEDCGLLLSSEAEGRGCFPLDDHILCKSCNAKRVQKLTSHMSTEL